MTHEDPLAESGPMLGSLCDVFDTMLATLRVEAAPLSARDSSPINVSLAQMFDQAQEAIQRLRRHTDDIDQILSAKGITFWEDETRRLWERVLTYLSWAQFEIATRRGLVERGLSRT